MSFHYIPGPGAITVSCPTSTATVGTAYSSQITYSGGVIPVLYAVASGSLPDGLTLNTSTGLISGTPTTQQTATFTISVTDACNSIGTTSSCTIQVNTDCSGFSITTSCPLPGGSVGVVYGPVTLTTTGGTGPYSWALQSGSLPAGLTLSPDGIISGTPT